MPKIPPAVTTAMVDAAHAKLEPATKRSVGHKPTKANVKTALVAALAAMSKDVWKAPDKKNHGKNPRGGVTDPPAPPPVPDTTPVSVAITPAAAQTPEVGGTVPFSAVVRNAAGAALTTPVLWSSSNPSVASFDRNGVLTAIAAGSASVTASVDAPGVTSNAVGVTVSPVTLPPPVGSVTTTVALNLVRFDPSSATTVTVQNAVPLAPGVLMPANLDKVAMFVGPTEIGIYVEALSALHSDGSLRAVLVGFDRALVVGTLVAATLKIGATYTVARLSAPTYSRGLPQAAALPTQDTAGVAYLISCDLVGPTLSVAAQALLGAPWSTYDAHFFDTPYDAGLGTVYTGYAEFEWQSSQSAPVDDRWKYDYYDRALIWFAQWVRTGNPLYWQRGVIDAYTYREEYLRPGVETYGGVQPYLQQIEGVHLHYVLTGDPVSRTTILGQTEILGIFWQHFTDFGQLSPSTPNAYLDGRSRARTIQGILTAWRLDPSGSTANTGHSTLPAPVAFTTILNGIPAALRQLQDGTGLYFSTGTTQLPYMIGMIGDSLLEYNRWYASGNTTLRTFVTESCRWLDTQWNAGARGFNYANENYDWGPGLGGGPTPEPNLNQLIANIYGLAWQLTGTASYKTRGNEVFSGGVDLAYISPMKNFNENYWSGFRYPALVN